MKMTKNKKHSFSPSIPSLSVEGTISWRLRFQTVCLLLSSSCSLPFLYPLWQPYQSAIEQNMQPEVEVEMNGQVTDQLSQLILCSLDTWTQRGPTLLVKKKNKSSPKLHKRRIRNAILYDCKLVPFWRNN